MAILDDKGVIGRDTITVDQESYPDRALRRSQTHLDDLFGYRTDGAQIGNRSWGSGCPVCYLFSRGRPGIPLSWMEVGYGDGIFFGRRGKSNVPAWLHDT